MIDNVVLCAQKLKKIDPMSSVLIMNKSYVEKRKNDEAVSELPFKYFLTYLSERWFSTPLEWNER